MAEVGVIKSPLEFLRRIRDEKIVLIQFTKKDGSTRRMECTLDFDLIPRDKWPKNAVNLPNILHFLDKFNQLHVYDLEGHGASGPGWKTVTFSRTQWLQTKDNNLYRVVHDDNDGGVHPKPEKS